MKYRMFKIFCILTLALMVLTGFVIPMAAMDIATPATVMGTITVNNAPTDGISVSGGGGSDTTHGGGKYAFDVSPDVSISITATYNGHSASTGSFVVKSGDSTTKNLNINFATATPTPTATIATPRPISTATPTPGPTTQTPTPNPTSAPYNPPPTGPVITAKPPPDPTPYPTLPAMSTPIPVPTINTSVTQNVSTQTNNTSAQSTDLDKMNDTSSGISSATAVPTMAKARSPGFEAILLLAAFLGVAYLFAIRMDGPGRDKKK